MLKTGLQERSVLSVRLFLRHRNIHPIVYERSGWTLALCGLKCDHFLLKSFNLDPSLPRRRLRCQPIVTFTGRSGND
jgi:hypothetical protein